MQIQNTEKVKRGEIYLHDFGDNTGSIQNGVRPVLVVQSDEGNQTSTTTIVAALTSVIKKRYIPSHIILGDKFGLKEPSMVMFEQLKTVNQSELVEYIGFVDSEYLLYKINCGLKKTLGLWVDKPQKHNRVADGVFQKNYESNAFLKRLKAMLDLGVIPENLQTQYTEFTPIDKAANAVITIVRYFNNEQTMFHIENDKFVSIQELTAMFNELNYSVKSISQTAFANLIKDIASDPSKKYILETFINELDENNRLSYESSIHIDLNFTKTYLHMLGFEWSDINVDYLRKYVGYFRKIGYFK